MTNATGGSWLAKHKVLTGAGGAAILLAGIGALSGGSEDKPPAAEATSSPDPVLDLVPVDSSPTVNPSPTAVKLASSPKPSPKATPKPTPKVTRHAPAKPRTATTDPDYGTCKAAKAAGKGPYYEGKDPEYEWYRDADGDGVVCE